MLYNKLSMVDKKRFKIIKSILLNMLFFCVGYALNLGGVNDVVSPYFYAFFFALGCLNINGFNYIIGMVASGIVYDFTMVSFVCLLGFVVSEIVFISLCKWKKGFKNRLITILLIILTNVPYFILRAVSPLTLTLCFVNLVLEIAFFYAYSQLFIGIERRGFKTRFAVDEFIGLILIIVPISISLYQTGIYGVNVGLVIFAELILLSSFLVGALECLSIASVFGLSVSMISGTVVPLGIMCLWALGVCAVKLVGRPIMVLVLIVVDVILGVQFNAYVGYGVKNLISLIVAGVIFILLPRKLLNKLKIRFMVECSELSLNELLKEEQTHILTKMKRLSFLFFQIHDVYSNMIIGSLDSNQIAQTIKKGLINKNCINCVKRIKCYDGTIVAERSIEDFVRLAVNKGGANIVDIPDFLASKCPKANYIMHSINAYLEEFRNYQNEIKKEDENKLVVSNQLLGISEILNNFTLNSLFGTRVAKEKEQALLDELLYNDIIVKECAIFEENCVFKRAILIVKNNKYKKKDFLDALNGFFKFKLDIIENKFAIHPGYKIITIVKASKYNYSFGVSKASPKLKSGDLYSNLDLENNKVMISISDGKGVGEKANRISEMTLSLIENFYKVGYSSNIIMDNVNEVMSFKSGENFCAIDVAVLDKNDGSVDFIKRGGTPTVIKSASEVKVIESDSLPVGVVENSKSKNSKVYLDSGDIVVLSSDGVFDAFVNTNEFAGFINNYSTNNMNEMAEAILNKAIKLYGGKVKDDMTVVCFRVILNR